MVNTLFIALCFLGEPFVTLSVKYYVIIFVFWELRRCTPPIVPLRGLSSGLRVLSLSLLRGFAGLKKPLGYPCLVRESAPRPVFEGFFGA